MRPAPGGSPFRRARRLAIAAGAALLLSGLATAPASGSRLRPARPRSTGAAASRLRRPRLLKVSPTALARRALRAMRRHPERRQDASELVPRPIHALSLVRLLAGRVREPLEVLIQVERRYGPIAAARMPGGEPLLFLSDPVSIQAILRQTDPRAGEGAFEKSELLRDPLAPFAGRQGMFTDSGPLWRQQRAQLGPHFQPRAIDHGRIAAEMEGVVDDRVAELQRRLVAGGGGPLALDLADELTDLTLEVLLETVVHARPAPAERRELREALREIVTAMPLELVNPTRLGLHQLPHAFPRQRRLARAYGVMDALVQRIVSERAHGPARAEPDVLDALLATPLEGGGTFLDEARRGRPPQELKDQLLTLILAGHETTAASLSWAFHELGRTPAALDRLTAELEQAGPPGAGLTRAIAERRLPFLGQVFQENLRLHSPAYVLARRAAEDALVPTVDGRTLAIAKDSQVVMPLYLSQRREELWGRARTGFAADRFHPERLDPENLAAHGLEEKDVRFTPFGAGPRHCLGHHFATLEGQLILAALTRSFRITPISAHARATSDVSLRIADGLPVTLAAR